MHDLYNQGSLTISARKRLYKFEQQEELATHIEITDDGNGMTEAELSRLTESLAYENISMKHMGVTNVAKRLQLLFPSKSRMEIWSQVSEGTRITLLFPYYAKEEWLFVNSWGGILN